MSKELKLGTRLLLGGIAGFVIARVPWRPETRMDVGDLAEPEPDTSGRSSS